MIKINLCDYETKTEIIKATKKMLLNNGFTVMQSSDGYFNYMKNNKFGYFQFNNFDGGSISSSYHANKQCGTRCNYKKGYEFTVKNFEDSLNFTFSNCNPPYFKDIQDYLVNCWSVFDTTVYTKNSTKSALDLLENHLVFISTGYAPVINKRHIELHDGIYHSIRDEKKAIFIIKGGDIEVLNHNINLFDEYDIFQKFKNRIKGV